MSWPQEGPWMKRGWIASRTAKGMRRNARFGVVGWSGGEHEVLLHSVLRGRRE